MTMRLDFSVGPVQGFVAQSRRTRDLWGSSYLLAFLSAHAMRGAREAGGRIVQPVVDDDPLYRWVCGSREGEAPRIGSLPNHFVVETDGDAPAAAQAAVDALEAAWEQVCNAVWEHFVEHACPVGNETERIWNRQVGAFWETMWTAGQAEDGLLARRKHWRGRSLPDEPGDKCTVMHDFQELSGYVRAESAESRKRQDHFWDCVRKRLGLLDLRDNERLCAVALVKRLFAHPKVVTEALGWEVDRSHWPSTVYVGAVPWVRQAASAAPQQSRQYAEALRESAGNEILKEHSPPFAGLNNPAAGDFPKLDASYFHREFIRDERLCPLADGAGDARDELSRLLRAVYEANDAEGRPLGPPPKFYALLLADGDRLGRLVGRLGGEAAGIALSCFTRDVPGIVKDYDGVTVYAGGDDVLAMLPAPQALACAASLSKSYRKAFKEKSGATLSAAVVFAPVRLPLGAVLEESHRLLDDIAKEANGRDSLAAGVMKRGGLYCQWATTWSRKQPGGGSSCAVELLEELTTHLKKSAADPGLSSSLVYRIRETLSLLCGRPGWQPGSWGSLPEGLDVRALLRAEILRSLTASSVESAEAHADELAAIVCKILAPSRTAGSAAEAAEAGVDALLLARFLSSPREMKENDG